MAALRSSIRPVAFLTGEASYTSGANLMVDGGGLAD
jgi:hypothetical protein